MSNMKTPEQITSWLEKQEWYQQFVANIIAQNLKGASTIGEAFVWDMTPEGFSFWRRINKDFLRWYNKEE